MRNGGMDEGGRRREEGGGRRGKRTRRKDEGEKEKGNDRCNGDEYMNTRTQAKAKMLRQRKKICGSVFSSRG